MWKALFYFQEILRFVVPLAIFVFPIPATLISMLLDVDALVAQKSGLTWRRYHRIDKILDYWFYLVIVFYCYGSPVFPYIFGLFLFRSIGQFLSLKSYQTKYLIFFPQIIDFYFLVYLFSFHLDFLKPLLVGTNNIFLIFVLFVIGLVKEFSIHVWNFSLADFLHVNSSWAIDKKGTEGKLVKFGRKRKK